MSETIQTEKPKQKKGAAPSSPPPDPPINTAPSIPVQPPKKDEPPTTGTPEKIPVVSVNPPAKSTDPPGGYRANMEREESTSKGALGQPLITVNPKDLNAQARIPSVMAMATHGSVIAWSSVPQDTPGQNFDNNQKAPFVTIEGASFKLETLAGTMGHWEFDYKSKSEGLDGKARTEYVEVSKLEAIGPSDDSILAQSVLNEGNKQLAKDKGKK